MGYPALDRSLGTTSDLCDPRSSWQKRAAENANGRLRRYLPGDAPPERLLADSLDALAARLNATPERCLGYRTPVEVFNGRLRTEPAKAGLYPAVSHWMWEQQDCCIDRLPQSLLHSDLCIEILGRACKESWTCTGTLR